MAAPDTSLAELRKRTSTTGVKPPPPNATKDGDSYDLQEMPPVIPCDDVLDRRSPYSVLTGKGMLPNHSRRVFSPYRENCFWGKFGAVGNSVRIPYRTGSLLSPHIPVVVSNGPQPQMLRADTRRVVAAMKNTQPLGDRPVGQFPRKTVRPLQPLLTVPVTFVDVSYPQPTPVRLTDSLPEGR